MSIGFLGLLTIVLIVLKLTGVINIAWLWVLSPIILSVFLALTALIAVFVVGLMKVKN